MGALFLILNPGLKAVVGVDAPYDFVAWACSIPHPPPI
jgi:hypothetical protein